MKKIPARLPLLFALIVLCSPSFSAGQEAAEPSAGESSSPLVIATKAAPPFVFEGPDGRRQGMSVDLWDSIARELGLEYEWREATISEMLQGVEDGSFDAAVAALTITPEREARIDFSHPFHISGLGIATASEGRVSMTSILLGMVNLQLLRALASLCFVLFAAGFFLWLFERKRNAEQFGGTAAEGLGAAFWWSAVTMTTVGYGDKAPTTFGGRVIGLIWMFAGVIIISGFTAAITSALTVGSLSSKVEGPQDLRNARVGSVAATTSAAYLEHAGVGYVRYDDLRTALQAINDGDLDAVVYDAPILRWTAREFAGRVRVLEAVFERQDYGFALPADSPLREAVNRALLEQIQDPGWDEIVRRHIGSP